MTESVRVVIADDAEQLRGLLAGALDKIDGIDVVGQAGDGGAAVASVALLEPDVLLLDLSMPVMDGLDVLRHVREFHPATAVLVFSGYGTGELAQACLDLGAAGYLPKGAPIGELAQRILEAAGR